MAEPNAAQLREVANPIDAGQVKIAVSECFGMGEVHAAQERLEKGHVRGKMVLTVE
jgi:NADPH:quinone reductase-like Zn-dependent oxidoreductase